MTQFNAVAWLLCALACPAMSRAAAPSFEDGEQVGTVQAAALNEASGLAASRRNPGVLWAHNDSGDSARVFALSTQGTHLGAYTLTGAGATDWEDVALGPGPQPGVDYLYLGDIGDNSGVRGSIVVYRVPEPAVDAGQSPVTIGLAGVESITLQYPDGARDAEVLLVDPLNGDLYVISKRETPSKVYRAAFPQSTSETVTMELKGTLTWGWAVGGDVSPSGYEVLVKGYASARLYPRPFGMTLWDALAGDGHAVPYTVEPQGEAIAFDGEGRGYFTLSEGTSQPLYYYARVGDPPGLVLDRTVLAGGRIRVTGPAAGSLTVLRLGADDDPASTRYAVQIGTDPDARWLRLDGTDAHADQAAPQWHPAAGWTGVRLRGLDAATAYVFRIQIKPEGGASPLPLSSGRCTTSPVGDVNRSGFVSALDWAYIKAAILRGGLSWPCDIDDNGSLGPTDLDITLDRFHSP